MRAAAIVLPLLALACAKPREPRFHARKVAAQQLVPTLVTPLVARAKVRTHRFFTNRDRCDPLADRWPGVLLDPSPDADETFCYALDQPWPHDVVASNLDTSRALLEDLRLFACAFTLPPAMLADDHGNIDPYAKALWEGCVNREEPIIVFPMVRTMALSWLTWTAVYASAADELEYEIGVVDQGATGEQP